LYLAVKDLHGDCGVDDPILGLPGNERVTALSLLRELGKPGPE
jgi:hypothetical protein